MDFVYKSLVDGITKLLVSKHQNIEKVSFQIVVFEYEDRRMKCFPFRDMRKALEKLIYAEKKKNWGGEREGTSVT